MPKIISKLIIDVRKEVNTIITAVQGDTNTRYLDIYLRDNGIPIDLTGTVVKIFGKKPPQITTNPKKSTEDVIYNIGQITDAENGRVQFGLTTQALSNPGYLECEISIEKITKDGKSELLTTPKFNILISSSLKANGAIESSNEYGALLLLFENIYDAHDLMVGVEEKLGIPSTISNEYNIETIFEALEKVIEFVRNTPEIDFESLLNDINLSISNSKNEIVSKLDDTQNNLLAGFKKLVGIIDDTQISDITTYSSQKINNELNKINSGEIINDTSPSGEKVYSSQKTQNELDKKVNQTTYDEQIELLQPKNAPTLETNSKDIVLAINEVNLELEKKLNTEIYTSDKETFATKEEIGSKADISNIYNKTEIDGKVGLLQPKEDNSLTTTNKTIVGAINELKQSGGTGGGGANGVTPISITTNKGVEVLEEELASYWTSTGGWSGGGQNARKSKGTAGDYTMTSAIFSINTTNLKAKNNGLIIQTQMSGLISPSYSDNKYMYASLTIGGYHGQSSVTRSISLGSCGGSYANIDYSNNDKFYYISLPELEIDDYLYAYLNVYCYRQTGGSVTVSCKGIQNFDYNFLIHNDDFSSTYYLKAGSGSSDLFITNSLPAIKYPSTVSSCIGIGNNIFGNLGTKDESTYCSSIVANGNTILQELEKGSTTCAYGTSILYKTKELNYGTIIGNSIYEDKTSSYPNYKYIEKLDYPISIGYGNKLTDESSNEITIGNYAIGNGSNTITLGDGNITGLYCQATAITQSCDPRLKENIEEVDTKQVIEALMQIRVIRASYRNLEEFKGSSENDKNKLMWDAENISNISLFSKDVSSNDRIVTPLDENGNPLTKTIKVFEKQPIQMINEDKEEIIEYIDVEVEKEIPEKELIENCKEFTPNQILQALVIGFQEQQKEITALKESIKQYKEN